MPERSPLAPDRFPAMPSIAGLRLAATSCGIRDRLRPDLCLAAFEADAAVAGVFTRSSTPSAAVDWCRACLPLGKVRAIVVNSGNANAFTGRAGAKAAALTAGAAAQLMGCGRRKVFVASTGVIGEPPPADKIAHALPRLYQSLTPDAWQPCAEAIMTTDTFPKGATRSAEIAGTPVVINGIAKGSGMVAPDMATMLAFVFTDAAIPAPVLQTLLARETVTSFNSITVDGDTSTSDTVLLCATGRAPAHRPVTAAGDRHLRDFCLKLRDLMQDLAQQIVRDGEGARKFVTIAVTGAASQSAARRIGLAIANSPLVKTAIAGEDPNWGRIVMAAGKSGQRVARDRLKIKIGGVAVAENGARVAGYDEAPVKAHMRGAEVSIEVDVGVGRGSARVWTCDLTHAYVSINAEYRT